MAERPILYSTPMIRARLDGRKTVTRRLLKPQPEQSDIIAAWRWFGRTFCGGWSLNGTPPDSMLKDCPYQPGDKLWARETWALVRPDITDDGCVEAWQDWEGALPEKHPGNGWVVLYAAMYGEESESVEYRGFRYRPSIHMPRWVSRLTDEVVSVRAERLHDITEEDARLEGMQRYQGPLRWVRWLDVLTGEPIHNSARDAFIAYFVTLPGGAEAWERNDWVWRVEMRPVEGTR
ncbi:hypothetical protein [Corallococcus sp. RDP092CA]|uniref:hypothetical protein n=1 Tax=Corallococcus sp. RDP092CA TaxID=3109369 RepID=UPI0035B37728